MSDNPVFDTVQALYPDVHIPDLLQDSEEIRSYNLDDLVVRTRRVLPPPKDLDELTAFAQEIIKKPQAGDIFPQHTVRSPSTSAEENRRLLRSPNHGR